MVISFVHCDFGEMNSFLFMCFVLKLKIDKGENGP